VSDLNVEATCSCHPAFASIIHRLCDRYTDGAMCLTHGRGEGLTSAKTKVGQINLSNLGQGLGPRGQKSFHVQVFQVLGFDHYFLFFLCFAAKLSAQNYKLILNLL
jgi:hypothetical protein